jgi:hypothetical protein
MARGHLTPTYFPHSTLPELPLPAKMPRTQRSRRRKAPVPSTSTPATNQPPHLPSEIWLQILSHINDPIWLWHMYRLGPAFLRKCSYYLLHNDWIPNKMLLKYRHGQDKTAPPRAYFSHHSTDDRFANFIVEHGRESLRLRTFMESRGFDVEGEVWLYVMVGQYAGGEDGVEGKVGLDAFLMKGKRGVSKVRVQWDFEEGDVKGETRIHIDQDKGVIGFDWRRLMDAFLTSNVPP